MNKALAVLYGAGVGAGAMFLLDPTCGRRRRAMVRDQSVSAWNKSRRAIVGTGKDLRNRTVGLVHDARKAVVSGGRKHIMERAGERVTEAVSNWSPPVRWIASATGGALAFYGMKRRDTIGTTMGLLGVGMLSRGLRGAPEHR